MVCEEGVETLEAPLVIVLGTKKQVREKERGREKGYGCINFSVQTEHNPVLYFYSVSGGLRYNYTVKRAGVATHCRTKDFHLGRGVRTRIYAWERKSEFCDRPKMLQNKFKKVIIEICCLINAFARGRSVKRCSSQSCQNSWL